jgi:CubicO group peptidase (beta-lactamase class C family)
MSVRLPILALLIVAVPLCATAQSNRTDDRSAVYYPDTMWQHKTPRESGLDPERLKDAIDFAVTNETKNPRDLVLNHYQTFGRKPFAYAIGPIKDRGDPTGLVIHHGYIVAEWGEPRRVDMTHSVTKSMLSTVIGVAYDRGMIRDINETVQSYMAPIQAFSPLMAGNKSDRLGTSDLLFPFDTPHNRTITSDHMLRQTSDREGTLWGKPDWADRPEPDAVQWTTRPRYQPGTVYKYNDVRVNALALAARNVWRHPLPQVLKETSWTRLAPPTHGAGSATRTRGSCSTATWCSPCPVAVTGAVACSSMPTAWAGSAISPATRQMEQPPAHLRSMGRLGADADAGAAHLRIHELVSQHQPAAPAERPGQRLRAYRQRHQHDLCRTGA